MSDDIDAIRAAARVVRSEFAPDSRLEVFQVHIGDGTSPPTAAVVTTLPRAALAFVRRLEEAALPVDVEVSVLPDPLLQPEGEALVRSSLAPIYARHTLNSTLISQYPLGARLTLLDRSGLFWRVRGEDGHVGWTHTGYLVRGELEWALAWERAEGGEPAVSIGARLEGEDGTFARLPWGARVIQQAEGRILLPHGGAGRLAEGEVVPVDRLRDRFPLRGDSVIRTAQRWRGAPYLWGGNTPNGVDCSGLAQAVYWMHGIALPRDSDLQCDVGEEVEARSDWSGLRPGDLLYFAEKRRVNHVALSLGGSRIIHASATNGGVAVDDLRGDGDLEKHLSDVYVGSRRLLPDR